MYVIMRDTLTLEADGFLRSGWAEANVTIGFVLFFCMYFHVCPQK